MPSDSRLRNRTWRHPRYCGFIVRYAHLDDIINDPNRCRAAEDVSYYLHTDAYKTVQPLIVDDFMTTPVTTQNAVGLF